MIGLGGKFQMVYHFIQFIQFTFSGLLVGMWEELTLHLAALDVQKILIEAQTGSWCKGSPGSIFGSCFPFLLFAVSPNENYYHEIDDDSLATSMR